MRVLCRADDEEERAAPEDGDFSGSAKEVAADGDSDDEAGFTKKKSRVPRPGPKSKRVSTLW